MGGKQDSIGKDTKSIFFESANFSPLCIRRTVMRHGVRTDSSTRFEKTLDPNQVNEAVLRFVFLAEKYDLNPVVSGDLISVGKEFEEKTIGVAHSFLENRSGVQLKERDVIEPLERLGFEVEKENQLIGDRDDMLYSIKIPSFRGAKDVQIKEDILEEVVRFFGFNNIALKLPELKKIPSDMTAIFRLRSIKGFLVRAAAMTEQLNYLYLDESFLNEIELTEDNYPVLKKALSIKNPTSENNYRIAPSLLPNLFKNIKHNCSNEDSMRFFECNRVARDDGKSVFEQKRLSGIFFESRLIFMNINNTLLKFLGCVEEIM